MSAATGLYGFCDAPSNVDQLGCDAYFEGLAEFIRSCPTPMTIAIQGDWGTGKSTAMSIVQQKIKDFGCHPIEFNTWKFSKSSGKTLVVPLIELIVRELDAIGKNDEDYKKEYLSNNKLKKIMTSIGGMCFLTGKGVLESITGAGNAISDVGNAIVSSDEDEDVAYFEVADKLHQSMQERIEYFEKDDKRIVVFVDDLDRLAPEDAVNLLEDLKNLMDFKNCIYVLALDHKIVMQGLSKKYGSIDKKYADRYFDKIIQLPFYLPVSSYKIDNFVKELNDQQKVLSEEEVEKVVNILDRFSDNNPRTIKRLLNLMLFYKKINNPVLNEHMAECFALNLLQLNHINYYEALIESMHEYKPIDVRKVLTVEQYYQSYCREYRGRDYWVELEKMMLERQKEDMDNRLSPQDVVGVFKELVNSDSLMLQSLLLATSVTMGNSVVERAKTTEETESLLENYLTDNFCNPSEITVTDNRRSVRYDVDNGKKYRITLSNRYYDHVNITVTADGNDNIVGLNGNDEEQLTAEIKAHLSRMGEEYGVNVNAPRNDEKSKNNFQILCEKNKSISLFSVSVRDEKSILLTGKLLRELRDNGVMFSNTSKDGENDSDQ